MPKCANCGTKEVPPIAQLHEDPYCSTQCAKEAHGVNFRPEDSYEQLGRKVKPGSEEHGTEYRYYKGCRCAKCKRSASEARRKRRATAA